MKGKDLTPLLSQPANPAFSETRGGVLFCYSQLMVHDPKFTQFLYETLLNRSIAKADQLRTIEVISHRLVAAGCHPQHHRRALQVQPLFLVPQFNTPTTLEELRAKNDLELYDLRADPDEVVNLAYDFDANRDLIAAMNAKLNALIANEIGVDDGSFLPLKDWIDWDKAGPASINL